MDGVLERLKVVLTGDATGLRTMAKTAEKTTKEMVSTLNKSLAQYKTLQKGVGDRFYAQSIRGAIGLSSAQQVTAQTLDKSILSTEGYLSSLRSLRVVSDSATSAVRSLAVQTEAAAHSNSMFANTAAATTAKIFNMNSGISSLQYSLADLNVLNYGLNGQDNWVQVWTAGSGRLVYAIDAVKKSLFGIIAPNRALGKSIKELIVPGLLTASTVLIGMKDKNPFAGLFGKGLAKVAKDIERVGSAGKTNFRLIIDELGRGFSAPLKMVQTGMQKFGSELGVLAPIAYQASAAGLAIGGLVKHTVLATASIASFATTITTKGVMALIQLSAAGLKAASIATLKGVMMGVSFAATNLAASISGKLVGALVSIPMAAAKATASLAKVGSGKAKQGAAFGAMDLLGPLGMLGGIGGSAYGAFKGAKTGLEWATSAETTRKSLETMTGSLKEADAIMKGVKDWGKGTPFLIPGLNESARQLLTFGVAADQIVPTMKTLGDLSGGNEETFKELSGIYARLKSQGGSVDLNDLNMIAARGVPIFDELAQVVGKSQGELRTMISEGKIGLADVQMAFVGLTTEGGKFYGGLAKQTDTVLGAWGKLKEQLGLTFQNIAEGFLSAFNVKNALTGLSSIVQTVRTDMVPAVVGAFEWLGATIANVVKWGQDAWQKFGPYIVDVFKSASTAAADVFQWLGNRIKDALTWVRDLLFGNSKNATDWGDTIKAVLHEVSFLFANWKDYLNIALVQATLSAVRFANRLEYLFTEVVPTVAVYCYDNFTKIFREMGKALLQTLENIGHNVGEFGSSVWEQLRTGFTAAWAPKYKELLEGVEIDLPPIEIGPRKIGPGEEGLKNEVDRLNGVLAARRKEDQEKFKQPNAPLPLPEAPKIPGLEIDDPNVPQPKAGGRRGAGGRGAGENRAIERGTVEAASARAKGQGERTVRGIERIDRRAAQLVEQQKRLNDNLKKQGLPPVKIGGGG